MVRYARRGVPADPTGERVPPATAWTPHARIHRYTGSVTESRGGEKLTIGCDPVDAPVAVAR
ncbi:hypothetical protein [Streptomyces sp.]|uniref:hypothetical protein n=1 Tax=Streptomyces sp. TaxID=1931 RepID=UPI002F4300A4